MRAVVNDSPLLATNTAAVPTTSISAHRRLRKKARRAWRHSRRVNVSVPPSQLHDRGGCGLTDRSRYTNTPCDAGTPTQSAVLISSPFKGLHLDGKSLSSCVHTRCQRPPPECRNHRCSQVHRTPIDSRFSLGSGRVNAVIDFYQKFIESDIPLAVEGDETCDLLTISKTSYPVPRVTAHVPGVGAASDATKVQGQ